MTSTMDLADRPRRLPIQVRLRPGESVDSIIRRLATANHLRPSYLRTYLNHPPGTIGSLQLTRLAQVTGRTPHALIRVFPGLNPDRRTAKPVVRASTTPSPSTRRPRSASMPDATSWSTDSAGSSSCTAARSSRH